MSTPTPSFLDRSEEELKAIAAKLELEISNDLEDLKKSLTAAHEHDPKAVEDAAASVEAAKPAVVAPATPSTPAAGTTDAAAATSTTATDAPAATAAEDDSNGAVLVPQNASSVNIAGHVVTPDEGVPATSGMLAHFQHFWHMLVVRFSDGTTKSVEDHVADSAADKSDSQ